MGSQKAIIKLLRSGYTGELNPELDEIASEYPTYGAAGMGMLNAATGASVSYASMSMQVPSGHLFHMRNLFIWAAAQTYVYFYDGPGTSQLVGGLIVSTSAPHNFTDLRGWVFQSIPCLSYTESMINVKISGIIRERDTGT